jgi:hypothetical protein
VEYIYEAATVPAHFFSCTGASLASSCPGRD